MDDIEQLRQFATRNSEEAFRAVVEKHVDFVYSVALRQLGDTHAAEEVAQTVFIDLARKAAALPAETVLSGWLFRAARFTAAKIVRSELRRQRREREAAQMEPTVHENKMESPWEQMEPLLNEALAELSEKDRSAVLLRFFEKKPLKDVGARLGLNEDAAKKRVTRAIEKLRIIFQRRGIALSSGILSAALSAQTTQAAPAGLAATIATNAMLKGAHFTASTAILGKGVLNIMAISKLKTAAVVAATLLLAGGTTSYVVVQLNRARPPQPAGPVAESADDTLALEIIDSMNSRRLDTAPPLVFLRIHDGPDRNTGTIGTGNGKVMGQAASLPELLAEAYGTTVSRLRTAGPATLPDLRVDYLVSLPSGQKQALQQVIREKLGIVAQRNKRLEDIYVLTARSGEFAGLRPSARPRGGTSVNNAGGQITLNNATIDSLVRSMERLMRYPIANETGLNGRFDIFFTYDDSAEQESDVEKIKEALTEQLGLELKPDKREMEILLVQTTKSP